MDETYDRSAVMAYTDKNTSFRFIWRCLWLGNIGFFHLNKIRIIPNWVSQMDRDFLKELRFYFEDFTLNRSIHAGVLS